MNLCIEEKHFLSEEVIKLGERLDRFEDQIKNTYAQIDFRDVQIQDFGKTIANLYENLKNRSSILQQYADTVLEKGKELYETQKNFEEGYNEEIGKLNAEEDLLKKNLAELRSNAIVNNKQKTELSKTLTTLTRQLKSLTLQDSALEDTNFQLNTPKKVNLANDPVLVESDCKHYQQLIEDTKKEIDTYGNLIIQRDEAKIKIQNEIEYQQKLSEMIDRVCDVHSSIQGMNNGYNDIRDQIRMYESEIQRKKYKIEKYLRQKLDMLEEISKMRLYQGNSLYNRSNLRQIALEEETSMIEEELNQSKSDLEMVFKDKSKQDEIIDNLKNEIAAIDKDLQQIEQENEKIYNFIDETDQKIELENLTNDNYDDLSQQLSKELNELKDLLKIQISRTEEAENPEDDIINSEQVVEERSKHRKLNTSLQLSVNKAQQDVSDVLEEINHTMESIEIMEHEKIKLLNDARNIHKKKAENRVLSESKTFNDDRVYILSKSVSQLENAASKMSESLTKKKDSLKKKESFVKIKSVDVSKSMVELNRTLGNYRDRVSTAERVAKVMTYISTNVSKQLHHWKSIDKGNIDIKSAEEWCSKLDKILRRADDLITWVQVFGKHNKFGVK